MSTYLIREGKERGHGRYLRFVRDILEETEAQWYGWRDKAEKYYTDDEAGKDVARYGGRVVRLLTPAEAKRKAQAEVLREMAAWLRGPRPESPWPVSTQAADEAERRADALWPRRVKR